MDEEKAQLTRGLLSDYAKNLREGGAGPAEVKEHVKIAIKDLKKTKDFDAWREKYTDVNRDTHNSIAENGIPTFLATRKYKPEIPLWRQFLRTCILVGIVTFFVGLAVLAIIWSTNGDVAVQTAATTIQIPVA